MAGFALAAGALAPCLAAQAPAAEHHLSLNAGVKMKTDANFGRSLGLGAFGAWPDPQTDVVVCATTESSEHTPGVGAGYAFANEDLLPGNGGLQLLPHASQVEEELGFGSFDVEIGNVRGAGHGNLVFIAAAHLAEPDAGAVLVFDRTAAQPGLPVLTIRPPADPPACFSDESAGQLFGRSMSLADIDGDGIDDLVVGAPYSTEPGPGPGQRTSHGRLYVFFGHAGFLDEDWSAGCDPQEPSPGYLERWITIQAPQVDEVLDAQGQRFVEYGMFGFSVDAADLDADGHAEILAGRPERALPMTWQDEGRAHLFHGDWVASHVPAAGGALVQPPLTDHKDHGVAGCYETLVDEGPTGSGFGFSVFMLGADVGRPGAPGYDQRHDVAVYSEAADFVVDGDVVQACSGALFVYFNSPTRTHVLDPAVPPVKLHTPQQAGVDPPGPQDHGRFGFAAVALPWGATAAVADGPLALPGTCLLVGEPDAPVRVAGGDVPRAGRAFLLGTPLHAGSAGGQAPNLWPRQLVDPTGVQKDARFGHWIEHGNLLAGPDFPGHEFLVAARGKHLVHPTTGQLHGKAGQVYVFRAGQP